MRRQILALSLFACALAAQEPTGCTLEVIAGGGKSFSGDGGPAALAEFDHPGDAVARPDGSIYVADTGNGRVRWISPDGVITTVLKTPEPARIAVSPEGDLFVFDRTQRRIIRRQVNGFVRTVLADQGLGAEVGLDAGPGPTLYLADAEHHRLLRLDRSGRVTTVAGDGKAGFAGDGGPAAMARLDTPTDVALGPDASLFVADSGSGRIRRIWPDGRIETLAVGPLSVDFGSYATFILGLTGSLDFTFEAPNHRIAVNADGEIAWTASTGGFGIPGLILNLPSDAGQQASDLVTVAFRISPRGEVARVQGPAAGTHTAIGWLPNGQILLGSEALDQVYALTSDASYEVVAGVGGQGLSGDGGPAMAARLRAPQSVAALSTGEIYIADEDRVRLVRPGGVIETADATLPEAYLASDGMDNLYIAGEEILLRRAPGGAVGTFARAADCSDCVDNSFTQPIPYSFGRIVADGNGLWVQGRSTNNRVVRITSGGDFLIGALPLGVVEVQWNSFFSYARSIGADAQGGLLQAGSGRIDAFDPDAYAWRPIPGSAGFVAAPFSSPCARKRGTSTSPWRTASSG